jgi:hypothetical protein
VTAHVSAGDSPQAAIDDAVDGGTVRLEPGVHEPGGLRLRSNVTLDFAPGAVLRASPEREGATEGHLLVADGAENVAVTGQGTIDGRGVAFMTDRPIPLDLPDHSARQGEDYPIPGGEEAPLAAADRPGGLVRFDDCTGVTVADVTMCGSPAWTLHLRACEDVTVRGVTIDNDPRIPNSDGVVPDMSRDVRISDCAIHTGDDAIPVKATGYGGYARPCEHVTVTNCTLSSRSGAVFVGGRAAEDIRHVQVSNCTIRNSNRGLAVRAYGPGAVEHVRFDGISIETRLFEGNWWGQAEPVYVAAHPHAPDVDCGGIRDLRVSNVTATAEQGAFLFAGGGATLSNVVFDGLALRVVAGERTETVGGNFDLRWIRDRSRPEHDSHLPDVYGHDVPALYARGVDDMTVRDTSVRWADDLPEFFSHAVSVEEFADLTVDGVVGRQAHPGGEDAVLSLRDGATVSVRDSTATAGAGTFVELDGVTDPRVFAGNDLAACEDAGAADRFDEK